MEKLFPHILIHLFKYCRGTKKIVTILCAPSAGLGYILLVRRAKNAYISEIKRLRCFRNGLFAFRATEIFNQITRFRQFQYICTPGLLCQMYCREIIFSGIGYFIEDSFWY